MKRVVVIRWHGQSSAQPPAVIRAVEVGILEDSSGRIVCTGFIRSDGDSKGVEIGLVIREGLQAHQILKHLFDIGWELIELLSGISFREKNQIDAVFSRTVCQDRLYGRLSDDHPHIGHKAQQQCSQDGWIAESRNQRQGGGYESHQK
jgi:hypothetical protein